MHTLLLTLAVVASVPPSVERPAASKGQVIFGASLVAVGTVGSVVTSVLGWKDVVGIGGAFAPFGYVVSAVPIIGAVTGVVSESWLVLSDIPQAARPAAWERWSLNLASLAVQVTGLVLIITGGTPKRPGPKAIAFEGASVTRLRDGAQLVLSGSF